jgi:hypothetical protein
MNVRRGLLSAGVSVVLLAGVAGVVAGCGDGADGPSGSSDGDVVRALPSPEGGWKVQFVSNVGGELQFFEPVMMATLDLDFPEAPGEGLTDDAWLVDIQGSFELAAGLYQFEIEHDGGFVVLVNDEPLGSQEDGEGVQRALVEFEASGGPVLVRIVATDAGGPFVLRLR